MGRKLQLTVMSSEIITEFPAILVELKKKTAGKREREREREWTRSQAPIKARNPHPSYTKGLAFVSDKWSFRGDAKNPLLLSFAAKPQRFVFPR